MTRFTLVALQRDERAVLRHLGAAGVAQLVHTRSGPETAPLPPHDRADEIARWIQLGARVDELRRSLEILPAAPDLPEPAAMTLEEGEAELAGMEARAGNLLKQRQSLLQRSADLGLDCARVSKYRGLDLPLEQPDAYSFLHFVTGFLPAGNLEKLQGGLTRKVALLPLPAQEDRQPLVVLTTHQGRAALERALQQAGFQPEPLPAVEGATTDTLLEDRQREQTHVSAALERLNAEIRALAGEYARPLSAIEALATVERRLLEAGQNFPRTEAAVWMSGWVPTADAPALETCVRQITRGRCVLRTAGPDNSSEEPPPVLLRHPRWLRPFQMLVAAYGLPNYREVEPTLLVALSYVLMFGMMFGDWGHGAVLAGGGLMALLVSRRKTVRDAGVLLLFGGLSGIVFGLIYGSGFGLPAFKKFALWHDPLEGDPMRLMYGALGIGIMLISLGLLLNTVNRFQRGDVIGGCLDKFGLAGIWFYWGALALILQFEAIRARGLVSWAILVLLGLPVMGWALKEPLEFLIRRRGGRLHEPEAGLFGAITESLVGGFEGMISYLANTISFVRLAAYAMSHAALLLAVFMMADEVKNLALVGGLLSVAVIILGNLVAIALEGVVAAIQALRLEYYEFFGKFFSGNGQAFTPFRLVTSAAGSTRIGGAT